MNAIPEDDEYVVLEGVVVPEGRGAEDELDLVRVCTDDGDDVLVCNDSKGAQLADLLGERVRIAGVIVTSFDGERELVVQDCSIIADAEDDDSDNPLTSAPYGGLAWPGCCDW